MTEQQMPEMPGFVYMGEIETPRGELSIKLQREARERKASRQFTNELIRATV